MALAHPARGPHAAGLEGQVSLRAVVQWGRKHDPYAPVILIVIPLVVVTVAVLLP